MCTHGGIQQRLELLPACCAVTVSCPSILALVKGYCEAWLRIDTRAAYVLVSLVAAQGLVQWKVPKCQVLLWKVMTHSAIARHQTILPLS